ncbi:hypothetical protein [Streptomyces sp. NPDC101249]|uniref:hypothetical protein n=1 Tax=Streptomyces sp. NPDC101249 TaxID=3366140 RepID=UPI00380233B7
MTAPVMEAVSARTLVDPAFFARLSRRVATVHGLAQEEAEAIADQTLAYLATSAQKADGTGQLSPSPTVDLGLHCFLEYTEAYDEFFASHGWTKVHHHPWDDPTRTYESSAVVIPRTLGAIRSAGYVVRADLWDAERLDCSDDSDGQPGDPPPCGDHG